MKSVLVDGSFTGSHHKMVLASQALAHKPTAVLHFKRLVVQNAPKSPKNRHIPQNFSPGCAPDSPESF
jgi:hypothetical protein